MSPFGSSEVTGPRPLHAAADPVFIPPTPRYNPGHGAISRPRIQPPGPLPVTPLGSQVLSPMRSQAPHSTAIPLGGRQNDLSPPMVNLGHSGSNSMAVPLLPGVGSGSQVRLPIAPRQSGGAGRTVMPPKSSALSPMNTSPRNESPLQPHDYQAIPDAPSPNNGRRQSDGDEPNRRDHYIAIGDAPAEAPEHTWRQTLTNVGPAVMDFIGATTSMVASQLGARHPRSSGFTGLASGLLWGASALASEAGNSAPYSRAARIANYSNLIAGGSSDVAELLSGTARTGFGYLSSAAWGISAISSVVHAATDTTRNGLSRGLQGLSGVANFTAAGFSAAAVHASSEDDTDSATRFNTWASAAWMVGAGLSVGAAYTMRRVPQAMPPVASESTPLRSSISHNHSIQDP